MANLHAVHSLSLTNLLYSGSKRDSARSYDTVHCISKMISQQHLGVKASGFHGPPVAQNIVKSDLTSKNLAIRAALVSDKKVQTSSGADGKVLPKKLKKVVLAYSDGLDTSVIVPWLRENYGCEVVCSTADVGSEKNNGRDPVIKKSVYSRDMNLWHLSHEGGFLEDPANEPKENMYMMPVDPEGAPDQPKHVKIGIVEGLPVSIHGMELSPASLLTERLNERIDMVVENRLVGMKSLGVYESMAGTDLYNAAYEFECLTQDRETIQRNHGIGRMDMEESHLVLVGMKSHGLYETLGGTVLFPAAQKLRSLTLDRETIKTKDFLGLKYAELQYLNQWECADVGQVLGECAEVGQAVLGVLDETKLFEVAMSLVAPCEITEREDPMEYGKEHNLAQESVYPILEHLRRKSYHFVSVGRGEKGLGVYMREARRSTSLALFNRQHGFWQYSWTLMSI